MAEYIVSSGVTSTGITLSNYNDSMRILYSGTANSTTVNSCGMSVSSGGTANSTTVNNWGYLCINSGGTANSTTVNSGGRMYVSSGGTATGIVENGGYVDVQDGANVTFVPNTLFSRLALFNAATVHSGTTANSTTVNSGGGLHVYSGGRANSTTVNYIGNMFVSIGGVANSTTVNSNGRLYVYSGGSANSPTVNSYGRMYVSSGGTANSTTVNSRGYLYVSSGGTATEIMAADGACLNFTVAPDTYIQGTSAGSAFEIKDGAVSNYTVNYWGYLCINSGGTATEIVENGGYVDVQDGANVMFAPNTFSGLDLSNAAATVHSGTTANSTTVNHWGELNVYSGGSANSTTVNSYGSMWVLSGGTATEIMAADGAHLNFTVAPDTYIQGTSAGSAFEIKDGAVSNYTVNCELNVYSGGTANSTTVNNGGRIYVSSGGVANSTTVNSDGRLYVSSGGTANSTTVNSYGSMWVLSGGTANSTTVNSRGYLYVSSGGTATEIVENGGYVDVQDGANVMFAPNTFSGLVLSNAAVTVHSGTTANSTTVNYRGALIVFSGGIANSTTVNDGGTLNVSGGIANSTTVSSGGLLDLGSGGTANSTVIRENGSLTVFDKAVAYKTTVSSGGRVSVSGGGTADSATIYANGELNLFGGGSAANAKVYAGGTMKVSSGGKLTGKMNFAFGAVVLVEDGSIVDFDLTQAAPDGKALLNDWSLLQGTPNYTITVDGTQAEGTYLLAENAEDFEETITVTNPPGETLGMLTVGQTAAIGVFNYSLNLANGVLSVTVEESKEITSRTKEVSTGQTSDGLIVSRNGYLYVHSGGTVNIVTVNDGGRLYISSGGTATGVTENGGYVSVGQGAEVTFIPNEFSGQIVRKNTYTTVHSGTTATSATVNYGGYFRIYSGGTANNVTISSGGKIQVLSGGSATEITAAEGAVLYLTLAQGTCITGASAGSAFSFKDCFLSGYQVGSGWINVLSGGRAYDTTVNSGGSMFVKSLGMASDIAVRESGELHVSSGGVATLVRIENGAAAHVGISGTLNDITVAGSGSLEVLSGGMLTGRMTFAEGAGVSMEEGSFLNFNISGFNPSGTALVNDLSLITGEWTSTLTVSDAQINGKYMLANGAAGFNRTITVQNTSGDELGTLSVGQKAKIGDADYLLNLNDGKLSVTVSGGSPAPMVDHSFFPGCFAGGNQSLLAKQTDRNVTIYADGEVFGNGLVLDPGWEIAGVGDLNGDGRDDFLRVNDEDYVVGEMTKITGSFTPQVLNFLNEGWEILGTGDFNGNGFDDVLIANPTGASETVGLLGYWESGVTWTLINGYSPEWECIATGDFNADGKCDMLWRNSFEGEGGGTYNAYCTWIVDDPVDWRMVSVANPKEWAFLCSGDFDGDGANDIAMINDVGVVGIWGVSDGWLSSWSILSAVTPEWALAGVGDFNGDGTDDIAWCNAETGLVGAWIVKNKELNSWQTIAVVS